MPLSAALLRKRRPLSSRQQVERSSATSGSSSSSSPLPSSPPDNSWSRKAASDDDSNVRRGAEVIRQQIRKQLLDEDDEEDFRSNADTVVDSIFGDGGDHFSNEPAIDSPTHGLSFSSDEFSDPWEEHQLTNSQPARGKEPAGSTGKPGDEAPASSQELRRTSSWEGGSSTSGSWADLSTIIEGSDVTDSTQDLEGPPPPPPDDDTPITLMGRDKKLKTKMVTYLVEPLLDSDVEDLSYSFVGDDYEDDDIEDLTDSDIISVSSYLPKELQTSSYLNWTPRKGVSEKVPRPKRGDLENQPKLTSISTAATSAAVVSPTASEEIPHQRDDIVSVPALNSMLGASSYAALSIDIPSPLSIEFKMLLQDPAYRHAQKAGQLWQSLVGQQIRFPSQWWNGRRAPPLSVINDAEEDPKWQYFGRYSIRSNRVLNSLVRNRAAAGRLLLHIIVQDLVTHRPVQDVAIGCFHPNARGVRCSDLYDRSKEDCRDVWLAVRKHSDAVSVVDSLLSRGQSSWGNVAGKGPLGGKQRVSNYNVRAVYGDQPPLETLFVSESELYERLALLLDEQPESSPPMAILEEFVFA